MATDTAKAIVSAITAAARTTPDDPRRVLLLRSDADEAAVKKRYKQLARQIHPDKNGGSADCAAAFMLIEQARATLEASHYARAKKPEMSAADKARFLAMMQQSDRLWSGPAPHGAAAAAAPRRRRPRPRPAPAYCEMAKKRRRL